MTAATAQGTLVRARWGIGAVYLVNGSGLGLWAGHIPLVRDGLALSAGGLGLALLGMTAGAMLAMPLMGTLAARFGSARCARLAGIAFALLLPLPLAVPSWTLLLLTIMALGAANGALDVAQSTQGTEIERRLARPIMSSVNGFFSLGGFLGAGLAGLLLTSGLPPLQGLAAASLALAAVVAVAGGFLVDDRHVHAAGGVGHGFRLPSRAAMLLGFVALVAVLAEGATMDWSAIYMVDVLGVPTGEAVLGFAGFSLAMTAARFGGDVVVGRLGRQLTLTASALLTIAGFSLVVLAEHGPTAVAGFAVAGLGLANMFPIMISAAARLPGIAPAVGVATIAMFAYSGGLAGPVLLGFGAELIGLRASLAMLVPLGLLLTAASLLPGLTRRLE